MVKVLRPVGHGLFAAGALFIALYLFAIYLKGPEAFYYAFDPLALRTYFVLLPLMPGAFFLWLSDQLSPRSGQAG